MIDHQDGDLLVSAAAGSGKTAVLVERVIRMVTDPDHPVPLSRMLIVTFTNAAADQMKTKIENALTRKIEEKQTQTDPYLEEQLRTVPAAHIQTNHSFSLFVLRQYITRIPGLDPGFRVADEAEAQLLKINVLRDTLEALYSQALQIEPSDEAKDFLTLVDCYGGRTQDQSIENLILDIYEFMESEPDPLGWLSRSVMITDPERPLDIGQLCELPLIALKRSLERMIREYQDIILAAPEGSKKETDKLEEFAGYLRSVFEAVSSTKGRDLYQFLSDISWPRATYKFKWYPDGDKKRNKLYDKIKEQTISLISLLDLYYNDEAKQLTRDYLFPAMRGLETLIRTFTQNLRNEKNRRNLLEIGDFEHYTLELLNDPSICDDLRNAFDYIFVDEYQDCNRIQETILQKIARKDKNGQSSNLFMVGDIKQSIYGFRQADPGLFLEKYKTYGTIPSTRRLLLSNNFRSDPKILDAVNFLFRRLMIEEVGGLAYGKEEELVAGLDKGIENADVQMCVLTGPELSSEELIIREAQETARMIREEILSGTKAGQIVILMRSTTYAMHYQQALKDLGISFISDSSENFYETREIQTVVSLLQVIDNPRQDIPLLGVLLSGIGCFTEDDLGKLRISDPEGSLYEALVIYPEKGSDPTLVQKVNEFLSDLSEWRKQSRILGIRDLIWYLYRQTGIYLYFMSMDRGIERTANLDLMIRKADSFEKGTFHGLYAFLQYIEQLNKNRQEEAEARTGVEGLDAVRLMTIHKSKGLEFPVVFLVGLGRDFNTKDLGGTLQMHSRFGLGLNLVDPVHNTSMDSVYTTMIRNEKRKELMAEELRLLYVAMTRAQRKLYLVGSVSEDFSFAQEEESAIKDAQEAVLYARDYLSQIEWVLQSEGCAPFPVQVIEVDEADDTDTADEPGQKEAAGMETSSGEADEPIGLEERDKTRIERICYRYPHDTLGRIPQLVSVSSVKQEALAEIEEEMAEEPAAVSFEYSEEHLSGSERGTLFHNIMAMADPAMLENGQIREALEDLVRRGLIRSEDMDEIPGSWIMNWTKSELFRRMKASKEVYREEPFIMSVPISELKTISVLAKDVPDTEDGEIMIQGIIDLFFREDDGWVLADYKTDKILDETKVRGYGIQLSLYQRSIEKATGIPVKEKKLYDVRGHREISC